jgi:hypothetical protein
VLAAAHDGCCGFVAGAFYAEDQAGGVRAHIFIVVNVEVKIPRSQNRDLGHPLLLMETSKSWLK